MARQRDRRSGEIPRVEAVIERELRPPRDLGASPGAAPARVGPAAQGRRHPAGGAGTCRPRAGGSRRRPDVARARPAQPAAAGSGARDPAVHAVAAGAVPLDPRQAQFLRRLFALDAEATAHDDAIRIGTRGSALALWQARYVAARLQTVTPGRAGGAGRDHLHWRSHHRRAAGRGRGHRVLHRHARARARRRRRSTSPSTATRTCRSSTRRASSSPRCRRAGRWRTSSARATALTLGHAARRRARRHLQRPADRAGAGAAARPRHPARCAATSRPGSAASPRGELDAIVLARAGPRTGSGWSGTSPRCSRWTR